MSRSMIINVWVLGLSILGACADKVVDNPNPSPSPSPSVEPQERGDENASQKRLCTAKVTLAGTGTSSLSGYFGGRIIKNLEGNVTGCLEIYGRGTNISGWSRIEYEDDYGITSFETTEAMFQWGSLKETSANAWKLDAIWMDGYGLIQASGTSNAGDPSGLTMTVTFRYYNFPSYQSRLDQLIEEVRKKCKSGEWTVARCMGYDSPLTSYKWWEQPTPPSPETQARGFLKDNGRNLGTIKINLGDIVVQ